VARNRTIVPGFWTSEQVVSVKPVARLLFLGLVSNADDDGRLKGSPAYLRMVVFPSDRLSETRIQAMRDELVSAGLIKVYQDENGNDLIWIPTWHKHQSINRYYKSQLPKHPEDTDEWKYTKRSKPKPI